MPPHAVVASSAAVARRYWPAAQWITDAEMTTTAACELLAS